MGKISLSVVQSSGTYLKGALNSQHRYMHVALKEDDNKIVAEAFLTFEQFSEFLVAGSETICTLRQFRPVGETLLQEKVTPPESVQKRTVDRFGESFSDLLKRIEDLRRDMHELVNGNAKPNKAKLSQLLNDVDTIKSHYRSNQTFVVKQGAEEVEKIQDNLRTQLSFVMKEKGLNIEPNAIKALEGIAGMSEIHLLPSSEEPIIEKYEMKPRQQKNIDDMTSMEVAEAIHTHLKYWEAQDKKTSSGMKQLYCAGAEHTKNSVIVHYVSYQQSTSLTLDEAKAYLKFLETAGEFKTHFWYNKK
jgi:hypothetical protein